MIKSIKTRLAAWHRQRETVRELSMLSNRELADLGIGRGDIPFVGAGSLLAAAGPCVPAPPPAALNGPAGAAPSRLRRANRNGETPC